MLIEFVLINICYISAVWQRVVWRHMKSLFQLRNLGQESGGSIHMKSPGASSHLTAPVLLASTFPPRAQTQLSVAVRSSLEVAGLLPPPLVSWQAVSIIAVPAGNCEAQVIIHGVDRLAKTCKDSIGKAYVCWETTSACHPSVPCWFGQVWLLVSVFVTMSALLVPALFGPRRGEIIHLSIHLRAWKPFITRPETSINYSDGRNSEERETFERQIHLDLIGKQVCSRLLSKFPLRWSLRDNGAKERR